MTVNPKLSAANEFIMAKYELTFLLNEEIELKNLKQLLEGLAAKIIKEDSWGKKTLSYPVKKNLSANFYTWTVDIGKDKIKELKKRLNLNEKLIRYLLLISA